MASPLRTTYRDPPVSVYPDWQNVALVKQALLDLELGLFRNASYLCDTMGRDDRISGVLDTRVNGLLGLPLEMQPQDENDKAAAALAEQAEKLWPRMFPESELSAILRWGIELGIGLGELLWETGDDGWVPRIKVWHPSFVWWNWGTRTYWVNTQDGSVEVPEGGGGKWLIYTPRGYYRGWMGASVRKLAIPWLVRGWARRDWARYSEKHGGPIIGAKVPTEGLKEDKDRFVQSLATIGTEAVVELPVDRDGKGFDLSLIEAMANTWEGFKELLGHTDTAISITILGQNLTTEVQGGSRAAAEVHDQVRKDFRDTDARTLSRALHEQVLKPWAAYNAGNENLAPLPAWQTEPPEDAAKTADALQKLGAAFVAFKTAEAPVNAREICEQQGIPVISEAEEAEMKQEAAKRAAQAQETMRQRAQAGQQAQEQGDDGEAQQLSTRERLPGGARRGQGYVDRLAEITRDHAAGVVQVDVQVLLHAVQASNSPAELKQRLLQAYSGMSLRHLAQLEERAHILAELAGRRSVLDDL